MFIYILNLFILNFIDKVNTIKSANILCLTDLYCIKFSVIHKYSIKTIFNVVFSKNNDRKKKINTWYALNLRSNFRWLVNCIKLFVAPYSLFFSFSPVYT